MSGEVVEAEVAKVARGERNGYVRAKEPIDAIRPNPDVPATHSVADT